MSETSKSGRSPNFYLVEVAGRILLALLALSSTFSILSFEISDYWLRATHLSWHYLPYRDFLWEFPPLTVLMLALGPLARGDGNSFQSLFVVLMIGFEYAGLNLLRNAHKERFGQITLFWSLSVLPLAMATWFRFDFMIVLLAVFALLALERKKSAVAPIVLGTFGKLWPVLLVFVLIARRNLKALAGVLVSCVAIVVLWWAWSPEGFADFVSFRAGDGFQIESIPGSVLVAMGFKGSMHFGAWVVALGRFPVMGLLMDALLLAGLAAVLFLVLRRRESDYDIFGLVAVALLIVICTSRLISPQYLTWLAPFLVVAPSATNRARIIFAVAAWLTFIELLWYERLALHGDLLALAALLARNALLLWLLLDLAINALHLSKDAPSITTHSPPQKVAESQPDTMGA